jgi:D-arabinose 1-dehydrogenase-like Zn-dependent alcohol dehydrogenase
LNALGRPIITSSVRSDAHSPRQDHHTISGGWGPWQTKFVVTGHEVVGKVVEVGSKVTEFKVGERVGVGAQVGSCHQCKACKNGLGMSTAHRDRLGCPVTGEETQREGEYQL